MDEPRRARPRKGRGAISNPSGRFEPYSTVAIEDGWGAIASGEGGPDEPERIATEVSFDSTRHIIARNDSPDVPFDRSINPYRGCEHGCVYCFARPHHAYLGLSPGLDFETRIFAKPRAAELLERELARPSYRPAVIALGANTDPYQPIEEKLRITRGILEVLRRCRHPVVVITKSRRVLKDLDILGPMGREGLAHVAVSVTTLDRGLARYLEPRASTPANRLEALSRLSRAGVPTAVLFAPVIPALNDPELEAVLEAAKAAGAKRAGYVLLRLPHEIKQLFTEWLETHAPARRERVLGLLSQTRGGALYESTYGTRMRGRGVYADLLARRFELACRRLELTRGPWPLDCSRFRKPRAPSAQLDLF